MTTARIKTLVVIILILTMGAGVVFGFLVARRPAAAPLVIVDGPLAKELNLTDEQCEKMKVIWLGVRNLSNKARFADDERQKSIQELLRASEQSSSADDSAREVRQLQDAQRKEIHDLIAGNLSSSEKARAYDDIERKYARLISEKYVEQYAKIEGKCAEAKASLPQQMKAAFEDAVAKTRTILTPDQREKYEKILERRLGAQYDGAHDAATSSSAAPPGP